MVSICSLCEKPLKLCRPLWVKTTLEAKYPNSNPKSFRKSFPDLNLLNLLPFFLWYIRPDALCKSCLNTDLAHTSVMLQCVSFYLHTERFIYIWCILNNSAADVQYVFNQKMLAWRWCPTAIPYLPRKLHSALHWIINIST